MLISSGNAQPEGRALSAIRNPLDSEAQQRRNAAHSSRMQTYTTDSAGAKRRKPDPREVQGSPPDTNSRLNSNGSRHTSGQLLGYARVSRADQNLDRQLDALEEAECVKVFSDDGVSGNRASRPALDSMLAYAREGDTILVQSLDRLGRSTRHLLELVEQLANSGIGLRVLNLGIDTRTPSGQLVLTVVAALAEMERAQLRERTLDGLAAAKARGRVGGRPPALDDERKTAARRMFDEGQGIAEIARILGVSDRTIRRTVIGH